MFSSVFLPPPQTAPAGSTLHSYQIYNIDEEDESSTPRGSNDGAPGDGGGYPNSFFHEHHFPRQSIISNNNPSLATTMTRIPFYSHQALTAHNRRMIIPYKKHQQQQQQPKSPGSRNNRVITSSCSQSTGLSSMRDEPLVMYRFFEFYCSICEQSWLSPLYRAKDGLFCRICHQFCQPRGIRHSFTPYLGKETCYGKYLCHNCNRGFSSYKSLSNCPDQCFQCGTLVYPYYQIAHSVLYQKIRKNDPGIFRDPSSPDHFPQSHQPNSHQNNGQNSSNNNSSSSSSTRRRRQYVVRKIASGMVASSSGGISSPAKQLSSNKKRLHCLNNNGLSKLTSSQLGRRQAHLKSCYSEPTIGNNNISY